MKSKKQRRRFARWTGVVAGVVILGRVLAHAGQQRRAPWVLAGASEDGAGLVLVGGESLGSIRMGCPFRYDAVSSVVLLSL